MGDFILKDISDTPDLKRLVFIRDVLSHVAQAGLRVPILMPSRSGEIAVVLQKRTYVLLEFIEADAYPSDPESQSMLFCQAGQGIARLHQALASYHDEDLGRKTWREDLVIQATNAIAYLGDGLPAQQAAIVRRIGAKRGSDIESSLCGLPEQLIHRDCHPGNILIRGMRVIGFIDCDHLCIGPSHFDLAYYAVHHLKGSTGDGAAAQRWLKDLPQLLGGYRVHRAWLPAEAKALPHAMLVYHLMMSRWFVERRQLEAIARELDALSWIDQHFDAIGAACA